MRVGNKTFRSLEHNLKQHVTTKFHATCEEKKVVSWLRDVKTGVTEFCKTILDFTNPTLQMVESR